MGFELADMDAHFGRRGLLRLFIDREGGVTLDDCERVSEQIGALLDVEDPLPGSYVLEVSSPGFDRRLRTLGALRAFQGREREGGAEGCAATGGGDLTGQARRCRTAARCCSRSTAKFGEFAFGRYRSGAACAAVTARSVTR